MMDELVVIWFTRCFRSFLVFVGIRDSWSTRGRLMNYRGRKKMTELSLRSQEMLDHVDVLINWDATDWD